MVTGLRGDPQLAGYLLGGHAAGDEAEHLALALGQSGGPGSGYWPARLARGGQYRPDRIVREPARLRLEGQLVGRRLRRQRRAVRPSLPHRLVAVGRRQQPGRGGQVTGPAPPVVSGPVAPLAVGSGQPGQRAQRRAGVEHALAVVACSRTCSSSPRLSGPGFAHTLTGTATRPMSCTSAARRSSSTSSAASPATAAESPASSATPRECPTVHMLFRSEKSAIADRQASSRSSPTTGCGPGSASIASSQIDGAPRPSYA